MGKNDDLKLPECQLCWEPLAIEDHLDERVCRFCCQCPAHGHRCNCGDSTANPSGVCNACALLGFFVEPSHADRALAGAMKMLNFGRRS